MITEKDLQEAIAECEGQRNPNANTCMKLAAFYIIRHEMFGHPLTPIEKDIEEFSGYSGGVDAGSVADYDSGSEFSEAIRGMDYADILPVMDELMESVKIVIPRLYDSVIARLRDI